RTLDIFHGAAARHGARRGALHAPLRHSPRAVRQDPPPGQRPLHFPLCRETSGGDEHRSGMTHYDVIIVGTGAGGGTLAYHLAPTGKKILLLERGDYVRREKDNWSSRAVNVEAKYHTKEVWRDKDGDPLHPHTNYYVGGNTKFYGAALFRLRKADFGEIAHHDGLSPAWPISSADLY